MDDQQIFSYVELTQATLKKAASQIEQHEQAATEARGRIPGIVNALQQCGLLQPQFAKRAEAALQTHGGALNALQEISERAVIKSAAEPPEVIGTPLPAAPASTKTAGALPANASRHTSPAGQFFVNKMARLREVQS